MKRISLATLAFLVGATACKDVVTSPRLDVDTEGQLANASNPPPPPLDTGAVGRFIPNPDLRAPWESPLLQPRFSIQKSSLLSPKATVLGAPVRPAFDFQQGLFFFSLPVIYTLNERGDAGALQFVRDKKAPDFSIATGKIKWDKGDFVGNGTIKIWIFPQGLLVIDVSSINDAESYFERCGDGFTPGERCFHVVFDNATWYPNYPDLTGAQQGSAVMDEGCSPSSQETPNCEEEID